MYLKPYSSYLRGTMTLNPRLPYDPIFLDEAKPREWASQYAGLRDGAQEDLERSAGIIGVM